MTGSKQIKYLDMELMEKMCHKIAVAIFDTTDDPIAFFHEHDTNKLDAALNLPRAGVVGQELYPSLIDKAVILYYALNKNHAFKNGNKRIATTSLIVFLHINGFLLSVDKGKFLQKTLSVAESDRKDKDIVLADIKEFIKSNLAKTR